MIVRIKILVSILFLIGISILYSCNPAKNNAATRQYQALLSRYNIMYNGDKHYTETLEDMEKMYQDDYDKLLYVHPAETRGLQDGVPQPSGDFKRSIEKAEKAIQLHSIKKAPRGRPKTAEEREWKTRGEYNPYLHNAWLLMGKAWYMNGDFQQATTIFLFISRHFRWLPNTVIEAKIWQARCYCALGWLYEAQDLLDGIKESSLTSKNLQRQYWIAKSSLEVRMSHYSEASIALEKAVGMSSGAQKTRLRYLLGQIYTLEGEKEKAFKIFSKIAGSITTDYRTRISARIAMSEVTPENEIPKEIDRLRRLTGYASNSSYLDRIYYAMGNLYLHSADTTKAIEAYEKSIKSNESPGLALAQSQLALGRLYYDRGDYVKAQPPYASAVTGLPNTYHGYEEIKRRSDILDNYAVYANNVHLQDSLLELAAMSPEDRMKVCEKLASEYREEQKRLGELEMYDELMAKNQSNGSQLNGMSQQPTVMTLADQDASWYFYSPQTVRAGRTQFQQQWGNRRLEDNWRRRDKSAVAFSIFDTQSGLDSESEENDSDETDNVENNDIKEQENDNIPASEDPSKAEYYLKDIPLTEEQKQQSNEIVIDGLYNMGIILQNDIKDYPRALEVFNELLRRFPDNVFRLEIYYNKFLIYARRNDTPRADEMQSLIVAEFPDSPLGKAMSHGSYVERIRKQKEVQDSLYQLTYNAYLNNENEKVHEMVMTMKEDYSTSELMPKFLFLDALAYATDGKTDKFRDGIKELLVRFPDTDLTPVVSGMLSNLNRGMKLGENNSNLRGKLLETRLGKENDEVKIQETLQTIEFELDDNASQLYIFLFPSDRISANQLLYDIGRHNFETFMARDFDIEIMSSGDLSLLIVSGLNNKGEALLYESLLVNDVNLSLPEEIGRIIIGEKDFRTLLNNGLSLADYVKYVEGKLYIDAQKSVLDEELYEIEMMPDEEYELDMVTHVPVDSDADRTDESDITSSDE